ncbi:MAG: phosphate acyltransferase, partial [Hyphomicrobium sp.]
MSEPRTIALDAMGGDHGPNVVVGGAALSLERQPELSFIF